MPLDTDFIRFSREMKPTKQCKISPKNLRSDQGGAVAPPPPPLNTPLGIATPSANLIAGTLPCNALMVGLHAHTVVSILLPTLKIEQEH